MLNILNKYTPEQQRHLELAPFSVFEAIAGADGIIEFKERQTFASFIETYDATEHSLTHGVMGFIKSDSTEMMKKLGGLKSSPSVLYRLSAILENDWTTSEMEEYREDLFNLGFALAGTHPKLTNSEVMALAGLAILLEIHIENHPAVSDRLLPVVTLLQEIDNEMGSNTN